MARAGPARQPRFGAPGLARTLRDAPGSQIVMADQADQGGQEPITMDARARDMLREIVGASGKARFVRIHVGHG